MGSTANEDKRAYMSRQATIDELQAKVSALLNIEKVLNFDCYETYVVIRATFIRISVLVSSSCRPWKRKRMCWWSQRRC